MVPHLVRAQNAYKNIMSFYHTHTHFSDNGAVIMCTVSD